MEKRVVKPMEIDREIVEWYAGQIGFEIKNASQTSLPSCKNDTSLFVLSGNQSPSQSVKPEQRNNFLSIVVNWIRRLLGIYS